MIITRHSVNNKHVKPFDQFIAPTLPQILDIYSVSKSFADF